MGYTLSDLDNHQPFTAMNILDTQCDKRDWGKLVERVTKLFRHVFGNKTNFYHLMTIPVLQFYVKVLLWQTKIPIKCGVPSVPCGKQEEVAPSSYDEAGGQTVA